MLRFILQRRWKCGVTGLDTEGYYTLDLEAPELEEALGSGGIGEVGYEHHRLVGVAGVPAEQEGEEPNAWFAIRIGLGEWVSQDGETVDDIKQAAVFRSHHRAWQFLGRHPGLSTLHMEVVPVRLTPDGREVMEP